MFLASLAFGLPLTLPAPQCLLGNHALVSWCRFVLQMLLIAADPLIFISSVCCFKNRNRQSIDRPVFRGHLGLLTKLCTFRNLCGFEICCQKQQFSASPPWW